MTITREQVEAELSRLELPDGGTLVSRDMLRAVMVNGDQVSFIIEAPSPEIARRMEPLRAAAEHAVASLAGVGKVSAMLTAHGPSGASASAQPPSAAPPSLTIGGHPKAGREPIRPAGVKSIVAIASGKGGVGKSTVSSNLAVALARQGRRVGLLDADIYGPSQPRMMGTNQRPVSPDGKIIEPLHAHGVKLMSLGLMMDEDQAVVWRGPMLIGALEQLVSQVRWGALDVLLVDLPPGTGDVQLTLCQKASPNGAIVVSTPQDVALLDARKAINMFDQLDTPILGMIENMSTFFCPNCGHESHIFGQDGVRQEAETRGYPFLGALPIDLATRLAGDAGTPVAAGDGPVAEAYAGIAAGLVTRGIC